VCTRACAHLSSNLDTALSIQSPAIIKLPFLPHSKNKKHAIPKQIFRKVLGVKKGGEKSTPQPDLELWLRPLLIWLIHCTSDFRMWHACVKGLQFAR